MAALKLINLQGWLGIAGSVILGVLLLQQMGSTRHWKSQSNAFEQRWDASVKAHAQTVANYRTAAELARKMDAANKARVEAEQSAVNERITRDYEARLADARARAERLRQQLKAGANPGGPGGSPMPGVPGAPGGPDGAPSEGGFPLTDRLIATEQALQLDGLQRWVREQVAVDRDGTTQGASPSSSESVSR